MNRRDYLKGLGLGALGGASSLFAQVEPKPAASVPNPNGKITITKVRPIMTAPQRARLIVVKVETSEPGLYGLGCATLNSEPPHVGFHEVERKFPCLESGRCAVEIG